MTTDERILIQRAKRGDSAAFEALMQANAPFVYNVALRTLNNSAEAEDLTQEAFVRAWKALPKYRADAQFRTWLYRIVTNLCYTRLPKLKTELGALDPDEDIDLPDGQQRVERQMLNSELSQHLVGAIEQLPESYRLLITMRHIQGMSYAEIAKAINMPLGTVKTGIFRARRELRTILEPYVAK